MKILLGAQSYQQRSKAVTGQRLVNAYAEKNPEGSKYPFAIYGTPGLIEWADTGSGAAVQGMQKMGADLYVISSNAVYKYNTDKVKTTVGTITGSEGRVDLSNNGTQMVCITEDGEGFVITSSTVTKITDGDFVTASSSAFLDGYTIVSKDGSGQFNISSLYDSTAWDALDFSTAEEKPDNLVRVFSFNSALWLFGETSYEVYYNSGDGDFPFEQIQGAVNTTRGCAAKYSVAQDDNTLFFVGDDRVIYRVRGYSIERISTHAVEKSIKSFSSVSDAFSFIYSDEGHKHLVVTFPTGNKTWCFDLSQGLWHERETRNLGRWRANNFEKFNDLNLVGDSSNGKIYQVDLDTYTEDGETMEFIVQGPTQWSDGNRISHDYVRLDVDAGFGLTTGQGSDPQVVMKYSDDGGNTWSNDRWASVGKKGEYKDMAIWRRNGQARERIYNFKITDPVRRHVTGAYADGRLGAL